MNLSPRYSLGIRGHQRTGCFGWVRDPTELPKPLNWTPTTSNARIEVYGVFVVTRGSTYTGAWREQGSGAHEGRDRGREQE
jgi:hypothetical protein